MRYLGGKSLMLDNIKQVIDKNTKNVKIIADLFSGSGAVALCFKKEGYKIISNDALYFSYILNRGTINLNKTPHFKNLKIKNPIEYLNNLKIENTNIKLEDCFIYQNYSPNQKSSRMYFQNENAIKIDIIRITIENWKNEKRIDENEYYYLLSSLISSVPSVSNITGVYGAYLKNWDQRTYNQIKLEIPEIINNRKKNIAYNQDANILVNKIKADLIYIDPPYNERQYLPNYHILETIAKYDNPIIKGITGLRSYEKEKSNYCKKTKVYETFDNLIKTIKCKYIIISYNNEGILTTEELTQIMKKYGKKDTFKIYEYDYKRYKNKIPNNAYGLKEQIYFIEKG